MTKSSIPYSVGPKGPGKLGHCIHRSRCRFEQKWPLFGRDSEPDFEKIRNLPLFMYRLFMYRLVQFPEVQRTIDLFQTYPKVNDEINTGQ